MKVKLNIKQRVVAFSLISNTKQASLKDWKILNDAKQILGLGEADTKYYKVVQNPDTGLIKWDPEKAEEVKEYDIPKRSFDIIEKDLREKNEKGDLNADEADLAIVILEE